MDRALAKSDRRLVVISLAHAATPTPNPYAGTRFELACSTDIRRSAQRLGEGQMHGQRHLREQQRADGSASRELLSAAQGR
jgi:hypothetical protein